MKTCYPGHTDWNTTSSAVLNLLDSIIPTDSKVVFLVNYISEYYLVKRIKERYTHPIVSVAHSAQWQLFFNGNRKKFEAIGTEALVKKPEINILQEKETFQTSDMIILVTNY